MPSRNNIDKNMAEDFAKKFPNTRVILDATEIPLQSMVKKWILKKTLKTMIVPLEMQFLLTVIHVWDLIGLIKTYKILSRPLPSTNVLLDQE